MTRKLLYAYSHASGLHLESASVIVNRWDAEWNFEIDTGECFVLDFEGGTTFIAGPVGFLYTGLWRSETGVVFVSHRSGHMHVRDPVSRVWQLHKLMDSLYGVWGLRDDGVYAWGDAGGKPAMRFFDGHQHVEELFRHRLECRRVILR